MSQHSGLIDWDPERRVKKIFHRQHDGEWVYETVQDVEPILDANKERQNHGPLVKGQDRHVASIPAIFIEKWQRELGIDYFNKDHQAAVNRLLNSSEYRWLRTDGSVL